MRNKQEVEKRIRDLESECEDIRSGKESYGESDPDELEKLELRIIELRWILGLVE
jgi:hypothetical protein